MSRFFIGILTLCVASITNAGTLSQKITHTIAPYEKKATVAIEIKSLSNGEILYAHNANRFLVPASNQKIFIGAASLDTLGPNFRYYTEALVPKHAIRKHVLEGNLYFNFSGDPSLTNDDLAELVREIRAKGIQKIRGSVILDDTRFNAKPYGPGWMWDELNTCYAAPVDSIIINHNCFVAYVNSAKQLGEQPIITYSVKTPYIHINNELDTIDKKEYNDCEPDLHSDELNNYRLTGCMPLNSGGISLQVAIRNSALYGIEQLKKLFHQEHISISGHFQTGVIPDNLRVLAVHRSLPFSDLLGHMLQHSDSLYADIFLMTLGHVYYNRPGNWINGIDAMQSVITKHFNVSLNNSNMVDGSGLSRYNLISPHLMVTLLAKVHHDQKISKEFKAALPTPNQDGTLRGRLISYENQIYAKTGTMTGVTSLSGYAKSRHHGWLAFSIIVNGFIKSAKHYKAMEDKVMRIVMKS